MGNKKPLLSICIPTYNRAEYLDKSLASIVTQKEFHKEDVEVVISDNASTDNTEEIVRNYQNQYKNIIYSKNTENVFEKNHPIVIGNAHGIFRKLCNDTIIFNSNAIQYMLNTINENILNRPILFFLNKSNKRRKKEKYNVTSFDSFLKISSFWTTWIGGFGIWEEDFEIITDKFEGCSLFLWHTKILLELVAKKKTGVIDNRQLFLIQAVFKKDLTYGLFNVFYNNYLGLCEKYVKIQLLSNNSFKYLKKYLLFDFFLTYLIAFRFSYNKYQFSPDEDIKKLILNAYRHDTYYNYFLFLLKAHILLIHIKKFVKNKIHFLEQYTSLF